MMLICFKLYSNHILVSVEVKGRLAFWGLQEHLELSPLLRSSVLVFAKHLPWLCRSAQYTGYL